MRIHSRSIETDEKEGYSCANPFAGEPLSGQYDWDWRRRDAERWAGCYGVTFREPRGTVSFDPRFLARACTAAKSLGAGRRYGRLLFDAVFAGGLARIGEEECVKSAEDAGEPRARRVQGPGRPGASGHPPEPTHRGQNLAANCEAEGLERPSRGRKEKRKMPFEASFRHQF